MAPGGLTNMSSDGRYEVVMRTGENSTSSIVICKTEKNARHITTGLIAEGIECWIYRLGIPFCASDYTERIGLVQHVWKEISP